MRIFLKILLIIVVILLIAGGGFVLYIIMSPLPRYQPADVDMTVQVTAERVAHGQKIVAMICAPCHEGNHTNKLVGRYMPDMTDFGKLYSKNITQDKTAGIGSWTDGQIAVALRTGVTPNGKVLFPPMPKWVNLSDEDLKDIIAYLKSNQPSVQPSSKTQPPDDLNLLGKMLGRFAFNPLNYPDEPITEPDSNNTLAFGKYLVDSKYHCYECHSSDMSTNNPYHPTQSLGYLSGGNKMKTNDGKLVFSPNLTFDKTGIADYSLADMEQAIRYGKAKDKRMLSWPMPKFTQMSNKEIKAIYTYLQSVPKSHHVIPKGPLKKE